MINAAAEQLVSPGRKDRGWRARIPGAVYVSESWGVGVAKSGLEGRIAVINT